MCKEKNCTCTTDKMKKKRRRRNKKNKTSLSKSKYAMSNPVQGPMQSYFTPAMPQVQDHYRNRDAEQYALNYLTPKKRQPLMLENNDNDQHGNRQRLLLDDHDNDNKHKLLLGDKSPSISKKKESTKKAEVIKPYKIPKAKLIEYTYDGLLKLPLKDLRSAMIDSIQNISEETLKQIAGIKGNTKVEAIIKFLARMNKNDDIDRLITPSSKSSPIKASKFEDNTAKTNPVFIDQTASTNSKKQKNKEKSIEKPAKKKTTHFSRKQIEEIYAKNKNTLLEQYNIDTTKFRSKTTQITELWVKMNSHIPNPEPEAIEEVAQAPEFNDNYLLNYLTAEKLKKSPDINPLHAKAVKDQLAKNLNTQLGSNVFETTTLGSGNDNIFPHALDD